MDPTFALLSILGTTAIGTMSPGPSFVVVVRASAALSRRDGLASALGMGCGGLVFAGLALAGLQAVLMQVSWLYLVLKVAGGAYLCYLGYRIWRGAKVPLETSNGGQPVAGGWRKSFVIGLAHPAQQSEDGDLVCQRVRGLPAASHPDLDVLDRAAADLRDRDGLVHHRRLRLLRRAAARDLSRRQAVDRPRRRRRAWACWAAS